LHQIVVQKIKNRRSNQADRDRRGLPRIESKAVVGMSFIDKIKANTTASERQNDYLADLSPQQAKDVV